MNDRDTLYKVETLDTGRDEMPKRKPRKSDDYDAKTEEKNFLKDRQANYVPRLMRELERACSLNFELEVVSGKFVVLDRDDRKTYFKLPADSSDYVSSVEVLDSLEWELDRKEKELRIAQEWLAKKQAALSKLSKEERELLGL